MTDQDRVSETEESISDSLRAAPETTEDGLAFEGLQGEDTTPTSMPTSGIDEIAHIPIPVPEPELGSSGIDEIAVNPVPLPEPELGSSGIDEIAAIPVPLPEPELGSSGIDEISAAPIPLPEPAEELTEIGDEIDILGEDEGFEI